MGGIQNCECGVGNSCDICNVVEAAEPTNAQLMAVLSKAMDNLKCLQTDVKSSRQDIICMKARIHGLESSRASSRVGSILGSREDIAMSSQEEAEIAEGGTEDEGVQAQIVKLKKLTTAKDRKSRMEEEKDRGLVVVKQKLRDKEKLGSASQTEGETSAVSSIFGLGGRRKKRAKKQKKVRDEKVASRTGLAGEFFPVEYSSSSGSSYYSCTDSESDRSRDSQSSRRRRRSRMVKSGAKLIKRPVIRTELWPHTVANEEEGGSSLVRPLACRNSLPVFPLS